MRPAPTPSPARPARVRFGAFGPPSVLEVVAEEPAMEPGPGEARVRVEASSVQYTDTLIRRGLYPDLKGRPPFTPGYDFVGVVEAVGEGVTTVVPGDRVADLCVVGGNARTIVRPAAGLVRVPAGVDAAEATTLVLSWLTAWQALFRVGALAPRERLLVTGGNGAVGLAAIHLAVRHGAEVFATASPEHHDALRAAGATPLPRDGWAEAVSALGGVDVVLDGVGADSYLTPYRALRRGGRLVGIGFSDAASRGVSLARAAVPAFLLIGLSGWIPDGRAARFYSIAKRRRRRPDEFAQDLATLFGLLERGEIRPDVAWRLTLDEVADAHARLEQGGLRGKLVVLP